MVATYNQEIVHNVICVTDVYSREIINMFFAGQVSELSKTLVMGFYSDSINVVNYMSKFACWYYSSNELDLFIPLSVTFTIFHTHTSVKQF